MQAGVTHWTSARRVNAAWLACVCVVVSAGCRVDAPIGPQTYGVLAINPGDDVSVGDFDAPSDDVTWTKDAFDVTYPDVPGPLCPGNLGCPCGTNKNCAIGVCLSVNGAALNCVDPCTITPRLKESCNGIDDNCDGVTDEGLCDDGNPCTDDTCAGTGSCAHHANTQACEDGNACTAQDACQDGACAGGGGKTCDDQNPCTTDTCEVKTGCVFVANGVACSDGDVCTVGDTCSESVCVAGMPLGCVDNNPCTDDTCKPATGCTFSANSHACDDGNACSVGDTCKGSVCQPVSALPCDDGNPCTNETCAAGKGCTSVPNTLACEDGNPCTYSDTCTKGACAPGKPLPCNDGNLCTTDSCVPTQGCVFLPNTAPCDDGNVCTTGDTCQGGKCFGKGLLACADQDVCTLDTCSAASGCTHTPSSQPCDDANACTVNDTCNAKGCTGATTTCDDFNACTTDVCDSQKGCIAVPNAFACDDGTVCTTGDQCSSGTCVGQPITCDDKNVCTLDTCNGKIGCMVTPLPDGTPCGDIGVCQGGQCAWGSDVQPATSCKQIHQTWPNAKTGTYWLDPDGPGGGVAYQVLCDMDVYGGGWLRIDNAWAQQLLVIHNPSPTQGKCILTDSELRAWDGFDGAPGYGHLCIADRPVGNWMAYSELRFEGIVLTGYSPNAKNTYDLTTDCYGMQHFGAFCAGPNDALQPPYDSVAYVSNGQVDGPLTKYVNLGKVWKDFQIRTHEEGPQLEGIVWNAGAYLLR